MRKVFGSITVTASVALSGTYTRSGTPCTFGLMSTGRVNAYRFRTGGGVGFGVGGSVLTGLSCGVGPGVCVLDAATFAPDGAPWPSSYSLISASAAVPTPAPPTKQ